MKRFVLLMFLLFIIGCSESNIANETLETSPNISEYEDEEEISENEFNDELLEEEPFEEEFDEFFVHEEHNARFKENPFSCTDQKFDFPFIDLSKVDKITPLGNLNPPEHTLPTNHVYIHLSSVNSELRSPGTVQVVGISYTENTETGKTDYSINFKLCEDVEGYFYHVKEISSELAGFLDDCDEHVYANGKYRHCRSNINQYFINSGDLIGRVGNEDQGNFDFGTYDFRVGNEAANPDRYYTGKLSIVCPFDFYEDSLKEEYYSKIDRTIEPVCGVVMQDIPGTLHGNWFYGSGDEWTDELAFVYDNHDPSKSVISIGGVFTDSGELIFTPEDSGTKNRAFEQVSDNEIYCYENDDINRMGEDTPVGKILIQLVNSNKLNIEHQSGSCSNNLVFNNPTVYNR